MTNKKALDLRGVDMTSRRTRDRLVQRLRERGIENEEVLSVIFSTPRHMFIDEALSYRAYEDNALPIGFNQTISQPFVVARMTEALLGDGKLNKVLEIGTGSGYQTAIIAQLAGTVYTVERIQGLIDRARAIVRGLRLRNIRYKYDDGNMGWPEYGPFDGIIVTASPTIVHTELTDQLALGGRMVIPVGVDAKQALLLITRTEQGLDEKVLEQVTFVPLLGGTI